MSEQNGTTQPYDLAWAQRLSPAAVPLPAKPPSLIGQAIKGSAPTLEPPPPDYLTGEGETVLQAIQRLARIQGLPAQEAVVWKARLRYSYVPSEGQARDWESGILHVLTCCQQGALLTAMDTP